MNNKKPPARHSRGLFFKSFVGKILAVIPKIIADI